ncbi:EEF1A lysine methyltransferase 2-like [Lingula anatina]|uniref:Protein-lysine N-methyltransferase LOC106154172 n=1 Tax=Lingula anatina TaxID=7574 RepID=A0A1S3HCX4_LINAN|nr:EEF1A lysine methyltransferase 2-like [Lingula anatina]|eukprot:XP_013383896.1 EEF1A lysine methyltransferase 2-like [Lingula anatina]
MAAPCDTLDGGFESSKLGTKQYWDGAYERELKSFQETGDEGEVWFGYDSIERVADWIEKSDLTQKENSILDLGCGNGTLLIELRKRGFVNLVGVDYCEAAIQLARSVTEAEDITIEYEVADVLDDLPDTSSASLRSRYDIVVDKGTFDAISLSPDNAQGKREKYTVNVGHLLKDTGLFIITSCNWTKEELLKLFDTAFTLVDAIPTPVFKFGGKTGNSVTSLVFKKRL